MGQQQKGNVLPHQDSALVIARLRSALPLGAEGVFSGDCSRVLAADVLRVAMAYRVDVRWLFSIPVTA